MHQVAVNIENGGFAWHLTYDVSVPDFFKHCFWQGAFFVHFWGPSKSV